MQLLALPRPTWSRLTPALLLLGAVLGALLTGGTASAQVYIPPPDDLIEDPLTRGEAAWVWVGLALAALPWAGLFAACWLR